MNTFKNGLYNTPFGVTENGANTYTTTNNKILDMFALGASFRNRPDEDCISLFRNAYLTDKQLGLRCLFYIGDVRGGQGERRFFRLCYKWLIENDIEVARKNLINIPKYKRWDDLIYICIDTPLQEDMFNILRNQLKLDKECETCSLLGKWLPSENTSSKQTKDVAHKVRLGLGNLTAKQYRLVLSYLRKKINVLERLMSLGKWNEIEFDKIPSKAGFIYRNAFARNDLIKEKYEAFINNKETKVNASTLYPYEIVHKVVGGCWWNTITVDDVIYNKYWENLPDYLNGDKSNTICVVDTSGSMDGTPLDVACSLGLYFGERNRGPFKDCFISFSSRPQLIEFDKGSFCNKVRDIYRRNLCENTNIKAVFDLLLDIAKRPTTQKEDIPENILIISDMEFDHAQEGDYESAFDKIKRDWEDAGFKMPHLIFWNVDARQNNIPLINQDSKVSFVSGFSPTIFQTIITGKTGEELMKETLNKYIDVII